MTTDEWDLYHGVIQRAHAGGLRFALGGGLAFSIYAGRWRDTKDMDLYILPEERERAIQVLDEAGFADYYGQIPYDRGWIYRGFRDGQIVDLIWSMPNRKAVVDESWFTGGLVVRVRELQFRLLAPEEMVFAKIYVMQRERCDWPDLLNILYGQAERMDWRRLLDRLEGESGLLGGLLSTFRWAAPERAARLPSWLWAEVGLLELPYEPDIDCYERAFLLDTRDWFGPVEDEDTRC